MRHWVFQANPKHYRIDDALGEVEQIWWRCPQHTGDVQVGDAAVIWRSGRKAGIVGVGRVIAPPQLRGDAAADRFVINDDESTDGATRVLLAVRASKFVAKDRVASIPEMRSHRIVTAPMGTVFPLRSEEWSSLEAQLADLPVTSSSGRGVLPPPFGWSDRAKGVMPMLGGYDGYLVSTRRSLELVDQRRPSVEGFAPLMSEEFDLAITAARLRSSFLRKVGIVGVQSGLCVVGDWAKRWIETGDDDIVTALLHSRCQLIGEFMATVQEPKTTDELLTAVNERYGMGWDTATQIDNRRGWLQSAGHTAFADGRIQLTDPGHRLLEQLSLYEPTATEASATPQLPTQAPARTVDSDDGEAVAPATPPDLADNLAAELVEASTDSQHPARFERAVRNAFAYLGFDAELLGGAGKTDVLVSAPLGKGSTYRVAIDAKTTGSGVLADQQVDWVTLAEHRSKHEADYSLLVGPDPHAGRLAERSIAQNVAVLSAKQLAGLCRQHGRTPLGLEDYRLLFATGGPVDTAGLGERSDSAGRLVELANRICRTLAEDTPNLGPLSARDLWLVLARSDPDLATAIDEIQQLLDTLASPLVGAISGDLEGGYLLATDPRVTQLRLTLLGTAIAGANAS